MRAILHATFGGHVAKHSPISERPPSAISSLQLHDSSVEEFEIALTQAQAAWRASRGRTRTATYSARVLRRS